MVGPRNGRDRADRRGEQRTDNNLRPVIDGLGCRRNRLFRRAAIIPWHEQDSRVFGVENCQLGRIFERRGHGPVSCDRAR